MDLVATIDEELGAFLAGRLRFEQLVSALKAAVPGEAEMPVLRDRLRDWVNVGRLPGDLEAILRTELARAADASPPAGDPGDEPTTPRARRPAAHAEPDGSVPLPRGPETRVRERVEDVLVSALLDGYRSYRGGGGARERDRGDEALDQSLVGFRSFRYRREADRAAAGQGRRGSAPGKGDERAIGIGSMLKDRFILDEEIGQGGMGAVYRAVDRRRLEAAHQQPYVAVKLLSGDVRFHPEAWRALEAEARKAQALAHPNIVTVYDFDRDAGAVFLVMELLHGRSLKALLEQRQPAAYGLDEARPILAGMFDGLAHAHARGVVHADVKPGNVFVTEAGETKLLDFGIATARQPRGFEPAALGGLTPAYASPEMIEGERRDPRDDVYGLGCVIFQLLAGRHPFDRRPATEAREERLSPTRPPDLPGPAWRALRGALSFTREARPRDAAEFRDEFFSGSLLRRLIRR